MLIILVGFGGCLIGYDHRAGSQRLQPEHGQIGLAPMQYLPGGDRQYLVQHSLHGTPIRLGIIEPRIVPEPYRPRWHNSLAREIIVNPFRDPILVLSVRSSRPGEWRPDVAQISSCRRECEQYGQSDWYAPTRPLPGRSRKLDTRQNQHQIQFRNQPGRLSGNAEP